MRTRIAVGCALTLAILGTLGWFWWSSLLPSSYSVMDMGYLDYGGGPKPAAHGQHPGVAAHVEEAEGGRAAQSVGDQLVEGLREADAHRVEIAHQRLAVRARDDECAPRRHDDRPVP